VLKIAHFGKYLPTLHPFFLEGEITSGYKVIVNPNIIFYEQSKPIQKENKQEPILEVSKFNSKYILSQRSQKL
tara:strand:- start:764 stop:982 length:219 start_codon:yes stop_codon:yes gene_type:complete